MCCPESHFTRVCLFLPHNAIDFVCTIITQLERCYFAFRCF